jgi:hypothetical protein
MQQTSLVSQKEKSISIKKELLEILTSFILENIKSGKMRCDSATIGQWRELLEDEEFEDTEYDYDACRAAAVTRRDNIPYRETCREILQLAMDDVDKLERYMLALRLTEDQVHEILYPTKLADEGTK